MELEKKTVFFFIDGLVGKENCFINGNWNTSFFKNGIGEDIFYSWIK